MRVQHILLVGLFRRLQFVLQAMAIVPVYSCHVHMRSSFHLQASNGGGMFAISDWEFLIIFFELMYSKGNGLGNKAEVTLIALCVLLCWRKFIHPGSIQLHFFFFLHYMFRQLLNDVAMYII